MAPAERLPRNARAAAAPSSSRSSSSSSSPPSPSSVKATSPALSHGTRNESGEGGEGDTIAGNERAEYPVSVAPRGKACGSAVSPRLDVLPETAAAAGTDVMSISPDHAVLDHQAGSNSGTIHLPPASPSNPSYHRIRSPQRLSAACTSTSDDMIKMASQAGLYSVSSALATQVQCQQAPLSGHPSHTPQGPEADAVMAPASASTIPDLSSPLLDGTKEGVPQRPVGLGTNSEGNNELNSHTSLTDAHMASALSGARRISSQKDPSPGTQPTTAAAAAAQVQMADIATQVASEESEKQLRLQALLKASGHPQILTAQQVHNAPTGNGQSRHHDGDGDYGAISEHSGSRLQLSVTQTRSPTTSQMASTAPLSKSETRLRASGLGHIKLPSRGVEQAWGRTDDGATEPDGAAVASSSSSGAIPMMTKFYNPADAMSGVPSLPLMPAPPLVMLPPPKTPSLRLPLSQPTEHQAGSLHSAYARPLNYIEATEPPSAETEAALFSQVAALDVIQTPNGTAKAGWWIPQSSKEDFGSPPDDSLTATLHQPHDEPSSSTPTFQTSCIVDDDTYAALATQAAYATSLLTTATSLAETSSDITAAKPQTTTSFTNEGRTMQPLVAEQYEAMKDQLLAWAGLHGPRPQAEAQQLLEARKINILTGRTPPPRMSNMVLADPTDPAQASLFFPPDFASHFQAQLQALTSGVYRRKYEEASEADRFSHAHEAADSVSALGQSVDSMGSDAAQLGIAAPTHTKIPGAQHNAATLQRAQTLGMSPQAVSVVMDHAAPPQTPPIGADGHDPIHLVSVASIETSADAKSEVVLDKLLRLAHQLYQTGGRSEKDANGSAKHRLHPTLLALLHTLHRMHPTHLPTLLLLSCAYYSDGDYAASLFWNDRILSIDPGYVEAMSNIGTTLRALGRWQEAESWWLRAIKLKPGYWDAYENLLGVLCAPQRSEVDGVVQECPPRCREALRLCEHVEAHVMNRGASSKHMTHKSPQSLGGRPTCLPAHMPASTIPRLQQLFWAKGNLKFILAGSGIPAAEEYRKVIELVTSPSERQTYTLRDLVVATCVVGLLSLGASLNQPAAANGAVQIMSAMNLDVQNETILRLVANAQWTQIYPGGLLSLVHAAGDSLVMALLRLGGGRLPTIMLMPEHTTRLCAILFQEFDGQLPSVVSAAKAHRESNYQKPMQLCSQTTSTTLLTLAKLFQDATANPVPSQHGVLTLGGIPASISLVLPLYYLSLSLSPSASTCNNLGILLSGLPIKIHRVDESGRIKETNGQGMALQYYTAGIHRDQNHPHLYTNLGSLLKDLGHHQEAIAQYEKAIAIRPTFDVALANLANSLRDIGRTETSLPYYRRALEANPKAKMPEAMCGLLNGLLSLNDWRETFCAGGLLSQVMDLVEKQLNDGSSYGAGALQSSGSPQLWAQRISLALGESRSDVLQAWYSRLAIFFAELDRASLKINEGGFVLRLIEHLHKRSQQRWYKDLHQGTVSVAAGDAQGLAQVRQSRSTMAANASRYARIPLPAALIAPSVPTVLPFHTFSYGIEGIMSPRAMRLISHRNALRITQGSLSQGWLPPHVYPPPAPPAPKINIGYVSSDFNNHPLAHLMQSTFGFHDLERFNVFLYATSASDQSPYRKKIEQEAQHFVDVSQRSTEQIVGQILNDGIHILMNLNGYTKGARNEIFAARPCPVQMHFMGFAGGMASGWTDYVIADTVVCPPEVTSIELWNKRRKQQVDTPTPSRPTDLPGDIDPEDLSNDWMYTERFIYMPHSYFVNDHKQGFREPETRRSVIDGSLVHPHEMTAQEAWTEEEERRWKARKELFPGLPDDFVIFATFNQLYKNEPTVFKAWLEILKQVPNSILWLLRFPAEGEPNVLRTAREWAGDEVCSRIIFTDIAPKEEHIRRGRVADLFLDTFEVNAHTTACDCLWSGTPILTLPKWKMKQASLVAASVARATGYGDQMIVDSVDQYVHRAVELAKSVHYDYVDSRGQSLDAVPPAGPVKASELVRLGASAKVAAKEQQQAATTGAQGAEHASPTRRGATRTGKEVVPAPVTMQQSSMHASQSVLDAVNPPRESMVLTQVGLQAPPGAVSRRGSGELLELRKSLYTTRDTSPLFDTERWMRDLERGYAEAWRRWSLGVNQEESVEWDALSEEERERSSGHIYVDRLE